MPYYPSHSIRSATFRNEESAIRVLIANKYHKITGGADVYALLLARLLLSRGHAVAFLAPEYPDNLPANYPLFSIPPGLTTSSWQTAPGAARLRALRDAVHNRDAARAMRRAIEEFRPEVIACQNIHYQVSPSILLAARQAGVPVVQTLHDFQPVCASYTLEVRGTSCEACRNGRVHNILLRRCFNDSWAASALAFTARIVHLATGSYPGSVQRFVSPSRFLKSKLESFGVPLPPIELVPNPVARPAAAASPGTGDYILFAGQVIRRKGVFTLLAAAERLTAPVVVAGDGPDLAGLRAGSGGRGNVQWVGHQSGASLAALFQGARLVVVPSESYENQPLTVLEAFAYGKPVVATAIGGLPELVTAERGWLVPPGDPDALADTLDAARAQDDVLEAKGRAAAEYVSREHDPDVHIERLLRVMDSVR